MIYYDIWFQNDSIRWRYHKEETILSKWYQHFLETSLPFWFMARVTERWSLMFLDFLASNGDFLCVSSQLVDFLSDKHLLISIYIYNIPYQSPSMVPDMKSPGQTKLTAVSTCGHPNRSPPKRVQSPTSKGVFIVESVSARLEKLDLVATPSG